MNLPIWCVTAAAAAEDARFAEVVGDQLVVPVTHATELEDVIIVMDKDITKI